MSPSDFDDAYSVSPAAMSDEQIALRDAMTVTAVSQAESVAAIAASLHSLLDGLCKSVERLERERDEMREVLIPIVREYHATYEAETDTTGYWRSAAQIPVAVMKRAEKLLAGG